MGGQPLEGGRFVGEFGGYLNIPGVRSAIWRALRSRGYDAAAIDPWHFPGVEECTQVTWNQNLRYIQHQLTVIFPCVFSRHATYS